MIPQFKLFFSRLARLLPFMGLAALYFFSVILIVLAFNYFFHNSPALVNRVNPFDLLIRWDSFHFLDIAASGYQFPRTFFPLYPLLVAGVSLYFPIIFSGYLVSFLSLAVALFFLYRLARAEGGGEFPSRALALTLFFPGAIFFALIYSESLFLALSTAFFYYAWRRRFLAAAVLGFFAALTKNVGIFLWPVYLIFVFEAFYPSGLGVFWSRVRAAAAGLFKRKEFWYSLLIPAGLLLYCFFCLWQFGDFLTFLHSQKRDEIRIFAWPWQTLAGFYDLAFIKQAWRFDSYNFFRITFFEFGSFLFVLAAAIYWTVKKRWPYAAYCGLNALLFACMFPMVSVNRYAAVVFPVFIFLAAAVKRASWVFYLFFVPFLIFFVFYVYLFAQGVWVA